ncbi:MAG: MinD/ParA family protein [Anaeromyxobacter sp.]
MDQAQSLREHVGTRRGSGGFPMRVVAVTSGKGGVGKTHISANLAVLAAKAGRRVLLIDADLGLANADIVLGICPTRHLGHLLDGSASAEEVLTEGPRGIRVLGASSGIQSLTALTDEQKLTLVSAFEPLDDRFDLVIVDCGAGIGDNVLFFAGAAQEALLVVSPEPTSLSDAYATVKVLSQDAGVSHFSVVANQAADFQGRDVFRRLTQVTDRFLDARLKYLGNVPRDEDSAAGGAGAAAAGRALPPLPGQSRPGHPLRYAALLRAAAGAARGREAVLAADPAQQGDARLRRAPEPCTAPTPDTAPPEAAPRPSWSRATGR